MRERPMLFNGPMMRAIIDRKKTQTRRPVTLRDFRASDTRGYDYAFRDSLGRWNDYGTADLLASKHAPYRAGDRLWCRERARLIETDDGAPFVSGVRTDARVRVRYEADGAGSDWLPYPSRLGYLRVGQCVANGCYREASRLSLDVVSVRVERVQDISEADAIAEGCTVDAVAKMLGIPWESMPTLHDAWREVWTRTYGAESWEADAWVWVVEWAPIDAAVLAQTGGAR